MFWLSLFLLFIGTIIIIKVLLLKMSLQKLCEELNDKITNDTNTPITLITKNPYIKCLAKQLNNELSILRKEKLKVKNNNNDLQIAITNISHDLRTPLTAIRGYIELLENEKLTKDAKKYLLVIKERTNNLCDMTEELFNFSIISLKTEELNFEKVNITSVLEESIVGFYNLFSKNKIIPSLKLPQNPVIKTLDKKALRRVFDNLISNAIKYSEGNLGIVLNEDGSIVFSNISKKLNKISVERLFDRFYTVESGKERTGLGLSIAKLLVEQMGGSIIANYKDNILTILVKW